MAPHPDLGLQGEQELGRGRGGGGILLFQVFGSSF